MSKYTNYWGEFKDFSCCRLLSFAQGFGEQTGVACPTKSILLRRIWVSRLNILHCQSGVIFDFLTSNF
jgi:hypothetical protein